MAGLARPFLWCTESGHAPGVHLLDGSHSGLLAPIGCNTVAKPCFSEEKPI
jgi:hypothetical protein